MEESLAQGPEARLLGRDGILGTLLSFNPGRLIFLFIHQPENESESTVSHLLVPTHLAMQEASR